MVLSKSLEQAAEAEGRLETLVFSHEKDRYVPYKNLSYKEQRDFDDKYPCGSGQTYEEWWGSHS